jgi:IS1 family transposase
VVSCGGVLIWVFLVFVGFAGLFGLVVRGQDKTSVPSKFAHKWKRPIGRMAQGVLVSYADQNTGEVIPLPIQVNIVTDQMEFYHDPIFPLRGDLSSLIYREISPFHCSPQLKVCVDPHDGERSRRWILDGEPNAQENIPRFCCSGGEEVGIDFRAFTGIYIPVYNLHPLTKFGLLNADALKSGISTLFGCSSRGIGCTRLLRYFMGLLTHIPCHLLSLQSHFFYLGFHQIPLPLDSRERVSTGGRGVFSLRFHRVGLSMYVSPSLAQQDGLPNHRHYLKQADDYQSSCEPCEFPLYGYILAALLASLIASWGGWLWGGGHRICGGLLAIVGLGLATSTLTAVGFADPLFWRVGWHFLTGKDPDRRDCGDSENRQPFQHYLVIVPQKYLDSLQFLGYSNSSEAVMANVLNTDKKIAVIGALAEGSSIRSIERITGVHRDTIMRLGVKVGQGCTAMMDTKMRNLSCKRLEMDEIWGFVGKKDRNVKMGDSMEIGSVWTFCAIDSDTKLVPAFMVGLRDPATAKAFVKDVAGRMANRVQVSTDGLKAYVAAMDNAFGQNVDYAQIIKIYGNDQVDNRRYSPPSGVKSAQKLIYTGNPDEDLISTSYVERLNATTRLHMRRLTRLTLAFSKKRENFVAAVGLHFAYYNFVKRHNTLRMTPAMAAGVSSSTWSVADLMEAVA